MTPANLQAHVAAYSCLNCQQWHNGITRAYCPLYEKCKAGRPLQSVPPFFKRKVRK